MSDPLLRLMTPRPIRRDAEAALSLGQILVQENVIDRDILIKSLAKQLYLKAPLGDILIADGHAQPEDVARALAIQYEADQINLDINPPAPSMSQAISAELCQKYGAVPWRWLGATLVVATDRPDQLPDLRRACGSDAPHMLPALAPKDQITAHISSLYEEELTARALTRVPPEISSRTWGAARFLGVRIPMLMLCLTLIGCVLAPIEMTSTIVVFGIIGLLMTTALKIGALVKRFGNRNAREAEQLLEAPLRNPPRFSVLVPLYREENIAEVLVERLKKLTYPKALLDVVLVLEAKDEVTKKTIARTTLPHWMRVIEVPDDGTITTKPRALNYAFDFCDGDIIGIWDAEDNPEPDQLEKVSAKFAASGPKTACVQGQLDYYNSKDNWMARCFTIEYAAWWRVVLPGVSDMGLVLPLGGTTLFIRRDVVEELGAWDAHNVTEDADLGLRLYRKGYTTELIPTVTWEEANCRPLAWIRQRSRWIKGYLITYCVHMRRPLKLYADLGWGRFWGVQAIFLGTGVQFLALPLLWSFWLPVLGYAHPTLIAHGTWIVVPFMIAFIAAEIVNIITNAVAASARGKRHLLPWIFTMPLYFPLAAIASYKALIELIFAPFYWDKTEHGKSNA